MSTSKGIQSDKITGSNVALIQVIIMMKFKAKNFLNYEEKRQHDRISLKLGVRMITSSGVHYYANTENISFGGAFINFQHISSVAKDEMCQLTLLINGGLESVEIHIIAKVTHVELHGIGLKFHAIEADNYSDFVNLIVYNSPDPELAKQKIKNQPNIRMYK